MKRFSRAHFAFSILRRSCNDGENGKWEPSAKSNGAQQCCWKSTLTKHFIAVFTDSEGESRPWLKRRRIEKFANDFSGMGSRSPWTFAIWTTVVHPPFYVFEFLVARDTSRVRRSVHIFVSAGGRSLCLISRHVTRVTQDGAFHPPLLPSGPWRCSWQRSSTAYRRRVAWCAVNSFDSSSFSVAATLPLRTGTISCFPPLRNGQLKPRESKSAYAAALPTVLFSFFSPGRE